MSTIANLSDCCEYTIAGTSSNPTTLTTGFQTDDGTVTAPAWSFILDTDTGIYRPASNTLAITSGGSQVLSVGSSSVTAVQPVLLSSGSAATPSLSFTADADTGLYRVASDAVAITNGGVVKHLFYSDQYNLVVPIRGPSASASLPTYSFQASTNTGMYLSNPSEISFSAGGAQQLVITTSTITGTRFRGNLSSSITFASTQGTMTSGTFNYVLAGDNDLGRRLTCFVNGSTRSSDGGTNAVVFRNDGGPLVLGISGQGQTSVYGTSVVIGTSATATPTTRITVDTSNITCALPISSTGLIQGNSLGSTTFAGITTYCEAGAGFRANAGAVGTPSYSFSADLDTGLYSVSANNLGIACGGALVGTFSSNGLASSVQPYAFYIKTSNQTASAGANLVTFDSVNQSQNSPVSYSAGAFTVPTAGLYHIDYYIATSTNSSGTRTCIISINEAPPTTSYARYGVTSTYTEGGAGFTRSLAANDVIRLYYYTPDTVDLSGSATGNRCYIVFYRLA